MASDNQSNPKAMKARADLKPKARLPRGLVDRTGPELAATRAMLEKIRAVYELYGFEPHDLANEGTMVLALPAEQAQDALGILRQFNPAASQIGVVQASDRHKVILNNPWGSRRYLELPQGELLPRIC